MIEVSLADYLEARLLVLKMEKNNVEQFNVFTRGDYADLYKPIDEQYDKQIAQFIRVGETCILRLSNNSENRAALQSFEENNIKYETHMIQEGKRPDTYSFRFKKGLKHFIDILEEFYWPNFDEELY